MIRWATLGAQPGETPHVRSCHNWIGFHRPMSGLWVENAVRSKLGGIASSSGVAAARGWTTLRRRLLLIITIALLPIVLVSVFQGIERVQRDVGDVRAQLTQSARASAENYQSVFSSGEQIMRAMRSLSDVRLMSGNCADILADAMIGVSYFPNLSRIAANGTLVSSALPLAKGVNISGL